jgi:hypothetical protein
MTWIHEIAGKSASGDLLFRDRRLVSLDSYWKAMMLISYNQFLYI